MTTENYTPEQVAQINHGFYDSKRFAAHSENGDLYVACVTAAEAGRIAQVKELVRHFNDNLSYYAGECRDSVNFWLELNA